MSFLFKSSPVVKKSNANEVAAGVSISGLDAPASRFKDPALLWEEVKRESKIAIPRQFSIEVISQYLTSIQVSLLSRDYEEEVNVGTQKPAVKGMIYI